MQLENRHFNIVAIIRRWWWLLILIPLLTSLVAYWIGEQQPVVYEASARLIIGPGIDSPSPDLNSLRTGGQLMQTYAQLATTRPVLQDISKDLGLDIEPSELAKNIRVSSNEETQFLTISVQDTNQDRVVAVANQIAETLVRMSPSGANSPAVQLSIQMRSASEELEQDIVDIKRSIERLEVRVVEATDTAERRLLLDELAQERSRLTDTNSTLASLYDSLSAASTNQVKIVETANFANKLDIQTRLRVMIGAMVGLVLTVIVMLTFEYFDDTIKSADEFTQATGVQHLGTIARHKALSGIGSEKLVVQAFPESRAAVNYRMLGIKLLFSSGSDHPRSVLFSSSQMGEDTGEIAANMAVVLAQTGKRVVLVDANLNRPTIGQIFGISDYLGRLTDVLTGQAKNPKLTPISWASGLSVLPTGPVSHNSFALLSSAHMVNLLRQLENEADIVIIATSPLLSSADSLILASRVDGAVIVARKGKTRPEMIREVVKSLHSIDAHIIGTVLDNNRSISSFPFFQRSTPATPATPTPLKGRLANDDEATSTPSNGVERAPNNVATSSLESAKL